MADSLKNVCAVCGRIPPPNAHACPHDGNTLFVEAPPPDPVLGQKLGDYQVLEAIGEGGMGLVYRGVQPVIKKRVAIKVLRAEFASDPAQVKRLVSEAEAVNSISHRNIIDIFGLGQLADGRQYIVMEFLDGEPLDRVLRARGPMPPLEVVELLIDVCGPLFAAHNAGVIHRDLKPSNVFLVKQPDGTRYLKLLDFGLAKQTVAIDGPSSQTSATQIAGTPDYISPEQCRGLDVSPRTDLYALGVMAWQMLTGRLPFTGATPMDVMMQQVSTPPVAPSSVRPGVPPDLDALVLALMEKAPEARPVSAEVVRGALKRIGLQLRSGGAEAPTRAWTGEVPAYRPPAATPSAPLPVAARPSSPPGPASAPAAVRAPAAQARNPIAAALGVVALIAAGVGGFWVFSEEASPVAVAPPPPLPPPPPAAVASVAPVAVAQAPEPTAPEPPAAPRKASPRDGVPTAADLTRRVKQLEGRLRERTGKGEAPDPSALQLLDKQRIRLTLVLSPGERRDVAKKLDSWERTFLRN